MGAKNYTQESEKLFITLITIIFVILAFIVLKDILAVIIFSFIFAYFLFPIHEFFLNKFKNERISALATLFSATSIIFIPIALLSYFLILNLIKILVQYKEYIENPDLLNIVLSGTLQKFSNSQVLDNINFSEYFSTAVVYVADFAKGFFSSMPKTIFYFFVMLFLVYYILIYNKQILYNINEYIPLSLKKQTEIIRNIKKNLRVLFRGYFFTGIIQTIVAMIGYIVFGVPNILILSFFTLFISIIPYLGTPLVWVPVSLYMIIIGNSVNGIGLLLYGTFIISTIDNFVRPILMSDKETISPPLVFVGFIGGMLAFGISGVILGPIIISICIILLKYFKEYYEVQKN